MTFWPAITGSGESVFTMERSADVFTVVPWVAELFPGVGSVVDELTIAVLDTFVVRLGSTWTTSVRVSDAPLAIVPRFHVTVPAESVPPPVAETNEVPAGIGSETTTDPADDGPSFVTPMV